jgi:hypothetical protein
MALVAMRAPLSKYSISPFAAVPTVQFQSARLRTELVYPGSERRGSARGKNGESAEKKSVYF